MSKPNDKELPEDPENTKITGLARPSCSAVRVLRLTLKRKWFDMIASGEKKEEYRQPGKWILSRLENKKYDLVEFKNGYGDVPTIESEYLGWEYGTGNPEWGGTSERVAIIKLGKILKQNAES